MREETLLCRRAFRAFRVQLLRLDDSEAPGWFLVRGVGWETLEFQIQNPHPPWRQSGAEHYIAVSLPSSDTTGIFTVPLLHWPLHLQEPADGRFWVAVPLYQMCRSTGRWAIKGAIWACGVSIGLAVVGAGRGERGYRQCFHQLVRLRRMPWLCPIFNTELVAPVVQFQ